jgi:hypothetical protein
MPDGESDFAVGHVQCPDAWGQTFGQSHNGLLQAAAGRTGRVTGVLPYKNANEEACPGARCAAGVFVPAATARESTDDRIWS